jgi:hypothetical protein
MLATCSGSGHHALVSHVDACYGLEREIDENGNELIVFGGVAGMRLLRRYCSKRTNRSFGSR